MPQMSPMYWLILMFYFIIMFVLMIMYMLKITLQSSYSFLYMKGMSRLYGNLQKNF